MGDQEPSAIGYQRPVVVTGPSTSGDRHQKLDGKGGRKSWDEVPLGRKSGGEVRRVKVLDVDEKSVWCAEMESQDQTPSGHFQFTEGPRGEAPPERSPT